MNNDKVVNTKDIKSVKQALKKENLKVNDTNIWVAKNTDPKQTNKSKINSI